MSSPKPSDTSIPRRSFGRKIFRAGFLVVLFFAALIFLAPYGVKLYVQKWLLENGADKAEIGRIGFNPFIGSLTLHDADVQRGGTVVFADSTVHVDIGLGMLFKRSATVQKARLADLVLDIEQGEDGNLRIASVNIPATADTPDRNEETLEAEQSLENGNSWIVAAEEVDISNVTLHYKQPNLDVRLFIEEGRIRNFTTADTTDGGTLYLKGTLNDSPVEIDLQKCKIVPALALEGSIRLDRFVLDNLDNLLQPFLNPFDGEVTIDGQFSYSMAEDAGMKSEYQGHILIADGKVGNMGWETAATLVYDGAVSYAGGTAANTLIATDGKLTASHIAVNLPETMNFSQQEGLLEGKTMVELGQELHVTFDGLLGLQETGLDMDSMQTDLASFSLQGHTGYHLKNGNSTLQLKGTLGGEKFNLDLPASQIHVSQQSLKMDNDLEVTLAAQPLLVGKTTVQGENLLLEMAMEPVVKVAEIGVKEIAGTESKGVEAGGLHVRGVDIPVSQAVPVGVSIDSIASGKITSDDLKTLQVEAIQAGNIQVHDGAGDTLLAAVGKLEVKELDLDEQKAMTAQSIQVEDGQFLQDLKEAADPLATLGNITTSPVHWSGEKGVECEKINVHSLYARVLRLPEDGGDAQAGVQQAEEEKPTTPTVSEEDKQPSGTGIPVKIDLITVDGESGFSFTDSTMKIPFKTLFQLDMAEVKGLDLNTPEQTVEYVLKGTFDKHASLKVNGISRPMAVPMSVEQTLTLRNYPLPSVSPYVVQAIGTYFDTGRADLKSVLKLKGDRIRLDNTVLLKELQTRTVDDELAAELNNQLPVPLDLALTLLRDGDNNIELDIPLSGNLSDLNVGITDILVTAVGKAITVAVVPYLAYTVLGPTGALVYMGVEFGSSLLNTDLPALSFEAQQLELTDAHKEILDKIGKKLEKQGDNEYSICPRVALTELGDGTVKSDKIYAAMQDEIIRKQLRELGDTRASHVKEYLVNNFSIDGDKLLLCDPGINFEKNGRSVIEFKK
ncbi:DUF748 domain-containing protein [Desulfogranum japonicum]|uniref:DUF748 domain-containing protein n=1 Tax=Desulfogranum japonicum TaxID=231447 RepID=UPI00040C754D|nr:DUF748 domain-containing protein [Desulfogranum japonicum]